jgi:DsbC/DsbD-like thiol-disulfide interchange protein
MRRLVVILVLLAAPALAETAPNPNMRVELVAEAPATPGGSARVGLRLKSDPGWHTYWRNPGDAGSPTEIAWTLPDGVTAGPIEWPAPQVIKEGDVVIFGYEGEVLLPTTIGVPASVKPGDSVDLKAAAYYVVCREICIPGEQELALALPVASSRAAGSAWPVTPTARPGWSARMAQDAKQIVLTIDTAGEALADPVFLPHAPGQVPPDAPQPATVEGKRLTLTLARAPELRQELQRMDGLLLATQIVDGRREPLAVVVEATR